MDKIEVMDRQITLNRAERPVGFGMLVEDRLEQAIARFDPISLREMDGVALFNRVDTKYMLSMEQMIAALENLAGEYRILSIRERRVHHYGTLYYDTPGFDLYHAHVTGRSQIYKVRRREYLDTRLSFLEVKHKDHKERTLKSRLPVQAQGSLLDRPVSDFLRGALPVSGRELEPKLWNTFARITLVGRREPERVTIDVDLGFFQARQSLRLREVVLVEVKQEHFNPASAFVREMRRLGVRPGGFSKYCFGVSQLYEGVKKNTQKSNVLAIQRIQSRGLSHAHHA